MRRRILTIALAVVLAAVGTLAVLAYVHQANERAVQGLKAVSVFVAQNAIPSGTTAGQALNDGSLVRQKLPVASVPADAVRSITSELNGLVTSANVPSGSVLTRPMLVSAAQVTAGVSIPKGMMALSVQLCLPEDVAGYVVAGVRVAVFDTYANSQGVLQRTCDVGHAGLPPTGAHTQLVLPRVQVLSIGPAPTSSQSSASGSSGGVLTSGSANSAVASGAVLVTVAVTQADAERLIQASETGLPYLALVTPTTNVGFAPPVALIQP